MERIKTAGFALLVGVLAFAWAACDSFWFDRGGGGNPPGAATWWQGNLHTHTLWSDGDDYPEMAALWYKDAGYDFLAMTDHNTTQEGERWIGVRGGGVHDEYVQAMGEDWVQERTVNGSEQVRLRTFDEYAPLLNEPGSFLLIQGEEITDAISSLPIHINAVNLRHTIQPQRGYTKSHIIERTYSAIQEQVDSTGTSTYVQLNHPNFGDAINPADIIGNPQIRFFEVHSGHPHVDNYGTDGRPSSERIWDIVLTKRIERGDSMLFGVAIDDAHDYHEWATGQRNPGRGWVVVRAAALDADLIVEAMYRGDFYASSGVELEDIQTTETDLTLTIRAESGVTYRTQFVGTRTGYEVVGGPDYSEDIGVVLSEVEGSEPSYTFTGDEMYVRAKVISSKPQDNPYQEGDVESAWTQPINR